VRRISLSFDNGPTPGVTDAVLDVLAARELLASFFVVGERLSAPGGVGLARRAQAEGHWIGNHSLTHTIPLGVADDETVDREIDGCERLLDGLAHADRLMRPYGTGGAIDARMLGTHAVDRLLAGGFTCVLWNSVPHDWDDPTGWVERTLADVATHEHTLVVLHDVAGAALPRLGELLDSLEDAGVAVVQDFPPECVPIRRGVATGALRQLSPLISATGAPP
jgi:peptidoglycan/xylan/chitin deacetylase (PgdA/CDA1 family)